MTAAERTFASADQVFKAIGPIATQKNLSGRDFFKIQQTRVDVWLDISSIEVGQTPTEPAIYLSHRITLNNGQFADVVAVSLDPKAFGRYSAQLQTGEGSIAHFSTGADV